MFAMRRYRKRLVIVLGSVLGVVLVLFVLFNLVVLNLFEGSVRSILELVPKKGITYVVTTEGMGPGLDQLLESSFLRRAGDSPSVRMFLESPEWKGIEKRFGVRENLRRLADLRQRLPFDVLSSVLGDQVLVAGSPTEDTVTRWDFLLFTRIDWKTKIGVDFCDLSLVKRRLDRSVRISRVPGERYRELGIAQGGKVHRFFFTRVRDVLVVTNKQPLIQAVIHMVEIGPSLSLGFDKTFVKATMPGVEGPRDFSFYVNLASLWGRLRVRDFLERAELPGQVRFLFDYVNPERVRLASGRLRLAESSQWVSEFLLSDKGIRFDHEYRIFNAPPVELEEAVGRFERFVPDTSFFFGFLKCPSKDLFTLLGSQVGQRGLEMVNERLAEKPRYKDFADFLTKTAANFGERVALALSRVEYDPLPYRPDPAVTLFFEVEDHDMLRQFLDYLTGDEFALEDVTEEEYHGVSIFRGYQKLPLIDWADELAYVTIGDTFLLSTSKPFLKKVVDVYNRHATSLFSTERFRKVSEALPRRLNGFGFWDFGLLLDWADDYKEYLAARRAEVPETRWAEFRAKAQRSVMAANPGIARELLDEKVEQEVKRAGDAYTAREKERWRDWFGERIRWARILGDAVLAVNFTQDRVQLRARLSLDLGR